MIKRGGVLIVLVVMTCQISGSRQESLQCLKYCSSSNEKNDCTVVCIDLDFWQSREKGSPMSQDRNYRKRAEECTMLAQTARTSAQRTMLLHIADTWMRSWL